MKINNSNDRVVPEFKKYYGIGNFKVVGINSSLTELEALGYPFTKEPEYKVNISGKDYSKLVFYVHNAELDIKTKLEFLISDREVEFSTGSKQYVNDLAQSSIGDSLTTCLGRTNKSGVAFFKNVNARAAKEAPIATTAAVNGTTVNPAKAAIIGNTFDCIPMTIILATLPNVNIIPITELVFSASIVSPNAAAVIAFINIPIGVSPLTSDVITNALVIGPCAPATSPAAPMTVPGPV